ncbi:MAG TPA: hypothetical protein VGI56_09615 [Galbitalea sp.]
MGVFLRPEGAVTPATAQEYHAGAPRRSTAQEYHTQEPAHEGNEKIPPPVEAWEAGPWLRRASIP